MKERLEKALETMKKRRDELLDEYLSSLEVDAWDNARSMQAVNTAGRLQDCDRHVTNLVLELKRMEVSDAS